MKHRRFVQKFFWALMVFVAGLTVVSCNHPTAHYLDQVKDLPVTRANPQLESLFRHWPVPNQPADGLVREWKSWLSEVGIPIFDNKTLTFVYYDFSHQASSANLVANFSPNQTLPMTRFENTPLFYRVFSIDNTNRLLYHYIVTANSGHSSAVLDPFNSFAQPGNPPENLIPDLTQIVPRRNYIWADATTRLGKQNLVVLLPPDYLRNFSRSYPVVYLVGMSDGPWDNPIAQAYQDKNLEGVLVVNLGDLNLTSADLSKLLINTVKPWIDLHYRTLSDKDNTVLLGWGQETSAVAQVASIYPDVFGRSWVAGPADQWSSGAVPYLSKTFPVVAP